MNKWLLAALAAGVLVYIMNDNRPRGIRLNNPMNIKKGNDWQGEASVSRDDTFETFNDPVFGIRAGAKTLLTYYYNYGLDNVRDFVNRYAPHSENPTEAYINAVAGALSVDPDERISVPDRLRELTRAIIRQENGSAWALYYSDQQIDQGVRRALVGAVV